MTTNQTDPFNKGDNSAAFGNNFITIRLKNPNNFVISKARAVVNGGFPKVPDFVNPVFPLIVNFDSEQSQQLRNGLNIVKLVVWDEQNRQTTCKGQLEFYAQDGVICNGCQC